MSSLTSLSKLNDVAFLCSFFKDSYVYSFVDMTLHTQSFSSSLNHVIVLFVFFSFYVGG